MREVEYQSLSPNIGVKNVSETVQFYTDMLDFKLSLSVPGPEGTVWAMVSNGKAKIMFQEIKSLSEEYPQLEGQSLSAAITFYIRLKGMKRLYEKIKNTKYLAKDMNVTPYGAEEFAVYDNNGYILTIAEDIREPLTIKNYDNLFLPAADYQESVRFYTEILGLEKKFEFVEQGMAAFKIGDEEPAIILKDQTKFPNTAPTIWIEVGDVKTVYDEMKSKGVQFLSEPFKIRTGMAVEFTDPSGNYLGFTDYSAK